MTALERATEIVNRLECTWDVEILEALVREEGPWEEELRDAIHSAIIEHEAQTRAVIREFVEANRAMSDPIGSDDDLERRLARWKFALEALEGHDA